MEKQWVPLRGKNRILSLLSFLKRGKWDICVCTCV
jgi:hypothetical protein